NGAGKSTLLRLLSLSEEPSSGVIKYGHNVKAAFYSQESALNLNYENTIWQEANEASSKLNASERRSLLGAFLFSGDDIYKKIAILSGGEKARLALFKLMLEETNLLILDEPTNHLDYETREVVERALLQYNGTLLIVSHDRHFLDILAERVLEIRNGKLYDYPGNYSWFLEKREELLETEQQNLNLNLNIKNNSRNDKLIERQERQRILNETRGLRKNISELESKINKLESGQAQIDLDLCSPEVLSNSQKVQELMQQRNFNAKELEQAYADWEKLNYELENYK
ncbi:MAG: ABC-F family ATP-binding cassette domain-containing protein, partial [Synergistaceae bacterium]|nr:ABC-F family ATP-binding cassette domain-containing protein [Synergistaceae bacterium]